jgi:purine-binding chemotaxis protein CheW
MTETTSTTEQQLVFFDLAGEHYGVDIATVREIIQMQAITRIPGSESYVEGLINLRGVVIPVIDLRKRFGFPEAEKDKDTRIIVIHCHQQDIGMIVDSVTEVLRITSDSVEPTSSVIMNGDANYLIGTAKLPDRLVILLDVQQLLGEEDLKSIVTEESSAAFEEPEKIIVE